MALDQSADHRDLAERALEQCRSFDPFDEFVGKDVGTEQARRILNRFEAIADQRVIRGLEAERFQAAQLHSLGQQHAERLVRIPPLERIGDHVMAPVAREGFDEQLTRLRQDRAAVLRFKPFAHIVGEARPFGLVAQKRSDARGEIGAHRHACADIGRDACIARRRTDQQVGILDADHLEAQSREIKGVARA